MKSEDDKSTEKIRQKAMKSYEKAMKSRAKEKFHKVVKQLRTSMNLFNDIKAYKEVEKVALRLIEMSLVEKEHNIAATTLIEAANIALLLKEYVKAYEHYKSAINFYVDSPKINKPRLIMAAACLASFVRVIQGRFDEGIAFFKKHLKTNKYKNMSKDAIIGFTEGLLNGLIAGKKDFLKNAGTLQTKLDLKSGEALLIEQVLNLANEYLKLKTSVKLSSSKIHAGDHFTTIFELKYPQKLNLINSSIEYDTNRLELDGDLTPGSKEGLYSIDFKAKVDGETKVGPIVFNVQTEDGMTFPVPISRQFKILPGKPGVEVILEPQQLVKGEKNELIFTLFNSGKGEASNLTVTLEFPETLLFVGGNNSKKLHSLKGNAKFPVSFLVTPLVSETLDGTYHLSYFNDFNEEFKQDGKLELPIF